MHRRVTRLALPLLALFLLGVGCGDSTPSQQGDAAIADASSGVDAAEDATPKDAGQVDAAPNILEEGECRQEEDCTPPAFLCRAPGEFAGCGICSNPLISCEGDEECTNEGEVCEGRPQDCFCNNQKTCRPGCTEESCEEGQVCGEDGHCQAQSCSPNAPCPENFECTQFGCARRSCTDDDGCNGNWCVKGHCQDDPGTCSAIPA